MNAYITLPYVCKITTYAEKEHYWLFFSFHYLYMARHKKELLKAGSPMLTQNTNNGATINIGSIAGDNFWYVWQIQLCRHSYRAIWNDRFPASGIVLKVIPVEVKQDITSTVHVNLHRSTLTFLEIRINSKKHRDWTLSQQWMWKLRPVNTSTGYIVHYSLAFLLLNIRAAARQNKYFFVAMILTIEQILPSVDGHTREHGKPCTRPGRRSSFSHPWKQQIK